MKKFVFQEFLFRSHLLTWTCKTTIHAIQSLPSSLKEELTDLFSPCIISLYLLYHILFIQTLAKAYLKCKVDDSTLWTPKYMILCIYTENSTVLHFVMPC